MNSCSDITFTIDGKFAKITFNRICRHNALTLEMLYTLDDLLTQVENMPELKGLLFYSASERFFSSGADIKEWGDIGPEKMGSRFIRTGNRVFRHIAELDIPTIAVMSGSALGGGLELALACDFRFAADDIKVGLPECSVGAIPGWMGGQRLMQLIGAGRTRQLILLGEPVDAPRAMEWGILNEVLPRMQLESRISEVRNLLQSRSSVSISVGKRLLRMLEPRNQDLAHEFAASVCKATEDAVEGVNAFRQKRQAIFK